MTNIRALWNVAALSLVAAVVLACACTKDSKTSTTTSPGASAQGAGADLSPDAVVATYGDGRKVTLKEVDEFLGEQLAELDKQKFQMRKQGVRQVVVQGLVKAEAAKKGQTEEQWLKSAIDDKVPAPTEEEIKSFYESNVASKSPNMKLEEVRERIVSFMTQPKKQEVAQKLFADLEKQSNVQYQLKDPPKPRKQVEAKGPSRGPEDAKVTIVEFSDFQCPYCSRAHDTVEQVMQAYAGKVRLVFRHFPLEFHQQAPKAAEASLCANDQGKFWEYHDVLFKNQQALDVASLKEHAKAVGLDGAKFAECLDSGRNQKVVASDQEAGKKAGVSGTPAFFINGIVLSGAQPLDEFKQVIDAELGTN